MLIPTLLESQAVLRCETIGRSQPSANVPKSYPRSSITIPVVFHIVYQNESENISQSTILDQLDILNQDYNGLNADLEKVPAPFKKFIGNPGFSFCLATRDPLGRQTTGIVRVKTEVPNIANRGIVDSQRAIKNIRSGGSSPWDTDRYLNIWVGARNDGILGDATFPNDEEIREAQGIVVRYDAVGRNAAPDARFNLGRTLTHEISHYFNVLHLWGSETGCDNDDDEVSDTPEQGDIYTGCEEGVFVSCRSRDMDTNFLNFRNDECLVFFTKGQSERMVDALFRFRYGLINARICEEIVALPPDPLKVANILTNIDASYISLRTLTDRAYQLALFDMSGRMVWDTPENSNHFYTLNHHDYASGIYILSLVLGDQQYARKIFIP